MRSCQWNGICLRKRNYQEHKAFWKSQQSRGEGEGGHQKHGTAVIEICISGNTGGRQFAEDSNNKKNTNKGKTQLKKLIKETRQHEIVFYSLSEMSKFALK